MGLIQWLFSCRRPRSKSLAGVRRRRPYIPSFERLEDRTVLDDTSASAKGIDARGLTLFGGGALDGSGVSLGQVEPTRPGKPGFDAPARVNGDVKPTKVYYRYGPTAANSPFIHLHTEQVAGVMIADGAADKGVAPKASLYASAYGAATSYADRILAFQKVADASAAAGSRVRAINASFGVKPLGRDGLDGKSDLTMAVDWGARVDNTLYVIAGPQRN